MTRLLKLAAVLVSLATLTGCYAQVERTITIDSEPEGARCWLNDNEIGRTPVTVPFTWYGTYGVRLEYPGYEMLVAEAPVKAPYYEWIPLDLAYETVVPGTRVDAQQFRFALKKAEPVEVKALRERAEGVRRDAKTPAP
jgi:hypothetical protein